MKTYDFKGKTIIPFATSGGSGMGASGKNSENLTTGVIIENGKCFAPSVSENSLMNGQKNGYKSGRR